jgi:hypothetical protein
MPWYTPITWTVGQYVTALDLNQQIRDNMNHIKARIDTAFPANTQTVLAGTWSTTSSTFSDIGTFTLTYTHAASHNILLWFTTKARLSAAGAIARIDFNIDGTRVGHATEGWMNYYSDNAALNNARVPLTAVYLGAVAAGTHTVKPQMAAAGGTAEFGYGATQFGYIIMGLVP